MRSRPFFHWIAVAALAGWVIMKLADDIGRGSMPDIVGDTLALVVALGFGVSFNLEHKLGELANKRADMHKHRADIAQQAFLEVAERLMVKLSEHAKYLRRQIDDEIK